jgi:hypothetical protein
MNASKNQVTKEVASNAVVFEGLEGRQMMSVTSHHHRAAKVAPKPVTPPPVIPAPIVINNSALTITQTGGILQVIGTTGNDQITISQLGNVFTIKNGSWKTTVTGTFSQVIVKGNNGNDSITIDPSVTENATLYGGTGTDTLIGNNGNDTFYAGTGINIMKGGTGRDTFVTIGSRGDTITGNGGNDTFWMDNSNTEVIVDPTVAGHVHRISSFLGGVSTTLSGQTFTEPAMTDKSMAYKNFSNLPLFNANGPAEDDIVQGYVGDCWYLSSLASVAKVNPDKITQSVVSLGDGTYAVQFTRNGQNVFARVDANLPTWYGQDAYANTVSKNGNSLWVAIMEKAMCQFTGTTASYSNIDGGWMSTAYDSMGISETNIWGAANATDLANQLASNLATNKAVTLAIGKVPAGAPLIGSHAYTVDHVTKDANGKVVSITLRNPWGVDGAGNDGNNDGYVTITPAQAFAGYIGVTVATA